MVSHLKGCRLSSFDFTCRLRSRAVGRDPDPFPDEPRKLSAYVQQGRQLFDSDFSWRAMILPPCDTIDVVCCVVEEQIPAPGVRVLAFLRDVASETVSRAECRSAAHPRQAVAGPDGSNATLKHPDVVPPTGGLTGPDWPSPSHAALALRSSCGRHGRACDGNTG